MSSNSISPPMPEAAGSVGLGYGIAIAVGILVLVSTIMLASYACVRVKGGGAQAAAEPAVDNDGRTRDADVVVVLGGLDGATIESYPKFVYTGGGGGVGGSVWSEETSVCSICLGEYSVGEVLRRMPECKHCFHARCVDEWLRMNASCPMCRNSPVPTPVATPLSELIPLAMHAR